MSARTVQIIINADDLGCTRTVNDAIFSLMDEGRLTSATIMANGPDFAYAANELKRFPHCSFGVHLNGSTFAPLTRSEALQPLLDERGHLSRKLFDARWTPALKQALQAELAAQVDHVRSAGVPISHFDSHEHIHNLPPLFTVFKALQAQFRIRRIRLSKNLYLTPPSPVLLWKKRLFNTALRIVNSSRTTAAFTEFQTFYDLTQQSHTFDATTVELMCHPGTSNLDYRREEELLRTDWLSRVQPPARLINYNDL
jgi:chitin disaccharide deacetylase